MRVCIRDLRFEYVPEISLENWGVSASTQNYENTLCKHGSRNSLVMY
jgi:hypothetical protein